MKILGTGSALPELTVTNDDLSRIMDTSDAWISSRTGIRERHVLSGENLFDLACLASERALENAGVSAEELDLIICSTVQGEWITPGMGCAVQEHLKATCPCVDINAACAGFVYALDMADCYMIAGRAKKILILCAEAISRLVDWNDRSSCILFGDGAGATVVGEGDGLIKTRLTTRGNVDVLYARASRGNCPFAKDADAATMIKMRGQDVYKSAVSYSYEDLKVLLEECGMKPGDVAHYLMHQANLRILEGIRTRLGVEAEKMPHTIDRTGNTSSASCAILLDEQNRAGNLHAGDVIALSAFGAGFVTGAALLRWTK